MATLIALLRAMNGLPFAVINLDLEPNQLDEAGLATTFPRRALEDARGRRACQPLVALSIHPRYIAAPLGDIDFATAAGTRLGLDEAVFMT